MKDQKIGYIIKALILTFLMTAILILLFAFILFKVEIDENVINLGVTFIHVISCVVGGFYVGKGIRERKFLWGGLVGLMYMVILCVVSGFLGDGNLLLEEGGSLIILCAGGGMLGGMFA